MDLVKTKYIQRLTYETPAVDARKPDVDVFISEMAAKDYELVTEYQRWNHSVQPKILVEVFVFEKEE